jgi:hypothetical protein
MHALASILASLACAFLGGDENSTAIATTTQTRTMSELIERFRGVSEWLNVVSEAEGWSDEDDRLVRSQLSDLDEATCRWMAARRAATTLQPRVRAVIAAERAAPANRSLAFSASLRKSLAWEVSANG